MDTVRITAKAYDQALRFCNARRKELGLGPPLKELPPGKPQYANSCPCAETCKGRLVVLPSYYRVLGLDGDWRTHEEGAPSHFVIEFDKKAADWRGSYVLPLRGLKAK